jgi:outer membrane receptor protein involved in Fe transport
LTTHEHFDRLTPLDGDGVIFQDYESQQHGRILATYQEVRLAGKFIGKGDWLVGGNYEYDSTWDSFLQSYGGSSATPIFGVIRLGPTNPVDIQQTTTYAVYANGEYPITDSILLQAGIRYTSSKKNFYGCGKDGGDGTWAAVSQAIQNFLESVNNPPGGVQDQGVNPGPGGCGTTGPGPTYNPQNFTSKLDEDNVSWRTGINWKPLPGQLLYFNVSQGWKSGSFPTVATSAFSQLAPAKQEGLLAYEGGFKSSLLDRTLQVNGAVFYYDYKDKQILGALDDPIFGALPALVNVPNSHVIGFEVSGVWQPVHGLTITPSVTYAHSNIDSCTVAQNANCIGGRYHNFDAFATYADFGNEPFPNAPEWSADVDGQYEWELPGNMTAFVGVNVNYQGYTRGFFYDRSAPLQPANILENPAHTLVDLRAGVDKDAWRFQLWGRNITNEYYWQSSVHVNDVLLHYAGMPATYGATISYRFQ